MLCLTMVCVGWAWVINKHLHVSFLHIPLCLHLTKVSGSYSHIVRYLPEVVPFFRKGAVLAEIGWQLPPQIVKLLNDSETINDQVSTCESITSTSKSLPSPSSNVSQISGSGGGNVKSIPLAGAFVRRMPMTKYVIPSDNVSSSNKNESDFDLNTSPSEYCFQEVIVLQSPDLSKSCVLAFENEIQFSSWFNALQKVIAGLNQRLVAQLNETNKKQNLIESKIVFINWFLEQQVLKMIGSDALGEVS